MGRYLIYLFLLSIAATGCAHHQNRHTLRKGETIARVVHRYQLDRMDLLKHNERVDLYQLLPSNEKPLLMTHINLGPERGPLKSRYDFNFQRAVYRSPSGFIWPVRGILSSKFGRRWGRHHNGIDISAPMGSPIKAARSGRVIHSGRVSGYGNLVILYHGAGYSSIYAHASKLLVEKGMKVKRGDTIAHVGSSGRSTAPHLHFELRRYKKSVNPLYILK